MWIIWLEKKILQTLGIILGALLILISSLHFYIVNNSEKLLEELVRSRSNNKVKLHVKNLKFNYFSKKIELESVLFYSIDSVEKNTTYRFNVKNIRLKVNSVLPIFTRKELKIDSLYLTNPDIEVIRLKQRDDKEKNDQKGISLSEEMGRIYNSIMDALQLLQVNRFVFNQGRFTLTDRTRPDQKPLTIDKLQFYIDNLRLDTTGQKTATIYSDKMLFETSNQDILFPDEKHWLGFSHLRIDIKNKLIEIDSCTVKGIKSDSSRAGFSIFIDTLKLANMDYAALYKQELIKADSVYCTNPDFNIVLESEKNHSAEKQPKHLDTIILQLTGDLQLKYIGVNNADINFITYNGDVPTSFTSEKNNFEMRGLSINHEAENPVTLDGFSMAIRNYENFLNDSSYFVRFDSVILENSKFLLSNFSVNTQAGVDAKNIRVSRFQLISLSWPDLLFNRKLRAREAVLYSPVIDYSWPVSGRQRKRLGLITTLGNVNKVMGLEKLRIINGNIRLKPSPETEVLFEDANMTVNTKVLTSVHELNKIENSVDEVSIARSVYKFKNLFVELLGTTYDGQKNRLSAEQLQTYNPDQTFNATAKRILMDSIQFNIPANIINANGLYWQSADIEIYPKGQSNNDESKQPLQLNINDLRGLNTRVTIKKDALKVTALVDEITADRFGKEDKLTVYDLRLRGNNLNVTDPASSLTASNFSFSDNQGSLFKDFNLFQVKQGDSLTLKIPELSYVPDVGSLMSGSVNLRNVILSDPALTINLKEKADKMPATQQPAKQLSIDNLEIKNPSVFYSNKTGKGQVNFNWKGNNTLKFENINRASTGDSLLHIDRLTGDVSGLNFKNAKSRSFESKGTTLDFEATDLRLVSGKEFRWSALFNKVNVKKISLEDLGKNNGRLDVPEVAIENLQLNKELVKKLPDLIRGNPGFSIGKINATYADEKKTFRLFDLSYQNSNHTLKLDSFTFYPNANRHEFILANPFQTDYMTFRSGHISMDGIDPDRYFRDSILKMGVVKVINPFFTSYRDKRPPFRHGIIKPLPPELISRIPFKLSVDTVQIANGTVIYTELNEKTVEEGMIPITRMSGDVFPIKNYGLTTKDSLRIRINGYLLDSAWMRLRVRQSYTDSLHGFLITLRMRPRSLTYLNPVLVPLAQVSVESGYLDTLQMRAVGNEYLSMGEMRLFYHDLRVKFLKEGSQSKRSFLSGLINFIANNFVVNKKNRNKPGVVYFSRLRDRSFINYYIKMAMSGVTSGVGAKSRRKLMRKYKKELKGLRLPPIEYD